jgi:dienelactone hydrolase
MIEIMFVILTLAAAVFFPADAPQMSFQRNPILFSEFDASGPFALGLVRLHSKSPSRKDPFLNDTNTPRELVVNVYYPAEDYAGSQQLPYIEDTMLSNIQLLQPAGGYHERPFNQIYLGVLKNPPVSKAKKTFPLIVFSPGSGSPPEFYMGIIRELVSNGFIVAGINHVYDSEVSVFPDGTVKHRDPIADEFLNKTLHQGDDFQGKLIGIISEDIAQALNCLKEAQLKEHFDFSRVGMLGHSLGGMAVTHQCLNNELCHAGVNMDGALLGGPSSVLQSGDITQNMQKPFLFMLGKLNLDTPPADPKEYRNPEVIAAISKLDPTLSLEEYYQFQRERKLGRIFKAAKKIGRKALVIGLRNADHLSFSDWALIDTVRFNKGNETAQLAILNQINGILRKFFERELIGKKEDISENMPGPAGFEILSDTQN